MSLQFISTRSTQTRLFVPTRSHISWFRASRRCDVRVDSRSKNERDTEIPPGRLRFNGDRFESDRFVGNRGNNPRKRSCPLETRGRSDKTRPRKQRYMRPLRVKDDQGHRGETVISLCRDTVAHLTDAISRMMRYVCSRLIKISIKRWVSSI